MTGVVAFLELVHGVGTASKMTASAPTGRQSQSPIRLNPSCLDASQVQQGEKLFLEIRDRSPAVLQVKSGRGSRGATAALIVPRSVWNRLSKPDQVNLTFFAESLIPEIRTDPATFADVPATAPTYPQAVKNIASLCDSCWAIVIGEVASTNRITLDETVVQGDRAWARDKFKPEVKASDHNCVSLASYNC